MAVKADELGLFRCIVCEQYLEILLYIVCYEIAIQVQITA